MEKRDDVVTYRVLVLSVALWVFIGNFGHYRVGDDVSSAGDEVDIGAIKEFGQRI